MSRQNIHKKQSRQRHKSADGSEYKLSMVVQRFRNEPSKSGIDGTISPSFFQK